MQSRRSLWLSLTVVITALFAYKTANAQSVTCVPSFETWPALSCSGDVRRGDRDRPANSDSAVTAPDVSTPQGLTDAVSDDPRRGDQDRPDAPAPPEPEPDPTPDVPDDAGGDCVPTFGGPPCETAGGGSSSGGSSSSSSSSGGSSSGGLNPDDICVGSFCGSSSSSSGSGSSSGSSTSSSSSSSGGSSGASCIPGFATSPCEGSGSSSGSSGSSSSSSSGGSSSSGSSGSSSSSGGDSSSGADQPDPVIPPPVVDASGYCAGTPGDVSCSASLTNDSMYVNEPERSLTIPRNAVLSIPSTVVESTTGSGVFQFSGSDVQFGYTMRTWISLTPGGSPLPAAFCNLALNPEGSSFAWTQVPGSTGASCNVGSANTQLYLNLEMICTAVFSDCDPANPFRLNRDLRVKLGRVGLSR